MMIPVTKETDFPAIYIAHFEAFDDIYIGSSNHPFARRKCHISDLRKGRHRSNYFQKVFDCFGEQYLEFFVAEQVSDLLFLRAREQFWLWRFEGRLLNTSSVVDGSPLGRRLGADQIEKMRARMLGNTLRRGKSMPESYTENLRQRTYGNNYRAGKPHKEIDKQKISDGLKAAYKTGKRSPSTNQCDAAYFQTIFAFSFKKGE